MRGNNILFFTKIFIPVLALLGTGVTFAVNSVPIASNYGLVQNTPGYLPGAVWTSDTSYNQRVPQAVYAKGPDLSTADCQQIVAAAVARFCSENNRCRGTNLLDVKPNVTILLAQLPNHNYASACGGFIDSEYKNYMENYSDVMQVQRSVPFPVATNPNPTIVFGGGTKNNTLSQAERENQDRANELATLQAQNGAGGEHLTAAVFPTTYSDLSFAERAANAAKGYEPYKDKSAYVMPKWEKLSESMARQEQKNKNTPAAGDYGQSNNKNDMIEKIAKALKDAKK